MTLVVNELGKTGINVTRLGFGAMEFRKGTKYFDYVPEKEANTILNMVLDSGINFIDTSIDYGESEDLIGKSISHRRSEFVLATKCSCIFSYIFSYNVWLQFVAAKIIAIGWPWWS